MNKLLDALAIMIFICFIVFILGLLGFTSYQNPIYALFIIFSGSVGWAIDRLFNK